MGSNPTLVEPGKIVELGDSIYKVEAVQRDAYGNLRHFTAQILLRDENVDTTEHPNQCMMEVFDEELLDVYAIH